MIRRRSKPRKHALVCDHSRQGGFSLLELMIAVGVSLVIIGGVVSVIGTYEQSYARTEQRSDMYENVRGVAELMTQEIGQAGLVSLPASTLSSGVAANVAAQTVNVSSTTSMFVGEQLLVDTGTSEELVTLTGVTSSSITAIFAKAHLTAAPINVLGVFPSGIVPPSSSTLSCVQDLGTAYTTTDGSTCNVLNLFGDVNGDGSLVYVRYTCTVGTSAAPGTLTRSVTTITPGVNTINSSQTLLSTVIGGAGAGCFQYSTQTAAGSTFVTNIGFTLSVQATRPDPQTGVYAQMTKSFLNLAPRNVLTSLELANASLTSRLQATPANVFAY